MGRKIDNSRLFFRDGFSQGLSHITSIKLELYQNGMGNNKEGMHLKYLFEGI